MPTYGLNGSTINLEHLQVKFAASADWSTSLVLLAGEIGVESDTHKMKVGDGTTTWGELPYNADPSLPGLISGLTTRMGAAESKDEEQDGRLDALEGITTISANSFSEPAGGSEQSGS